MKNGNYIYIIVRRFDETGRDESSALDYYANHTAQIEIVRHDRTME